MKYEDLTDEDIAVLNLNGCGVKGFDVPDWFFTASCRHHDYGYWRGGTEEDRKICDLKFYQAMKADVARLPWYKRFHYITAYVYYIAVKINGKKYFYYSSQKRDYIRSNS